MIARTSTKLNTVYVNGYAHTGAVDGAYNSRKFTVREAVKFALALTPTPQTNQPPTHRHMPLRDATHMAEFALPSLPACLTQADVYYKHRVVVSFVQPSFFELWRQLLSLLQIITLEIQNSSPPPPQYHRANKKFFLKMACNFVYSDRFHRLSTSAEN